MKKYWFIIWALLFNSISFAQGEASFMTSALPTLAFQQSPFFIGAGQIGAAVPMKDPIGFYLNPAQLGYFSQENNFAFLAMPQKAKKSFGYPQVTVNSFGGAAGYNFNKRFGLPISVGIGYIHNKFSYGTFIITGEDSPAPFGEYESYDAFDCFSLGTGINYYLHFNIGLSIKRFNSILSARIIDNKIVSSEANGTTYDFGIMITAPAARLFFNNVKLNLDNATYLKPKLDITLGYSLTNQGKEIYYVDPSQSDPLPRTARLGYTLDFGINLFKEGLTLNAIGYSFTSESEDMLAKSRNNGGIQYQGMFGGIKPIKQIIQLDRDNEIVEHTGNILTLFETIYAASGRYVRGNNFNIRSYGYGFSTEGIFKLLSSSVDNQTLRFITDHLTIEYYDAYNYAELNNTNYQGIAVYIKGIQL